MKNKTVWKSVLVLVLGTGTVAFAQQDPSNQQGTQGSQGTQSQTYQQGSQLPGQVRYSQTASAEATVEAIDQANRVVTLKGEGGNTVRVKVGENAPNFDQLKVGDHVRAKYYQSTAIALAAPGESTPPSGTQEQVLTARGANGEGPTRVMVNTSSITATIQDIDHQNRTVTLKGPEGNTMKVQVDPSVQRFNQIKVGDQVTATITDALALSVQRE